MRALLLIPFLCLAAAPPSYTLTESEEAQLAKGKVAVRHQPADTGGGVVAFAHVKAAPRKVLDEVMNLHARVDENGAITSLEVYLEEKEPERLGATWTLSVLGSKVVFHLLYECQRDDGFCVYQLDPDKESDLVSSEGHYIVTPRAEGTLLIYMSNTDTGRSMPGFLRRWIAGSSLNTQVEGIRERAEKP
ncbi:MAG: hypothetical protein EA397_18205 [Deltaproteobacteria bacterium]|nr:MAG: hypothetical protein EA397_18205 [Deltaproteobacteria bacterium]